MVPPIGSLFRPTPDAHSPPPPSAAKFCSYCNTENRRHCGQDNCVFSISPSATIDTPMKLLSASVPVFSVPNVDANILVGLCPYLMTSNKNCQRTCPTASPSLTNSKLRYSWLLLISPLPHIYCVCPPYNTLSSLALLHNAKHFSAPNARLSVSSTVLLSAP